MSIRQKAGKPEKTKESWSRKYDHLHKLYEDTYNLLVKRLKERTIDILDANPELKEEMEDAASGHNNRDSLLGASMIMDKFYGKRLNHRNLPDTAAKHILVGSGTFFECSPSIDCVGGTIRKVLERLYALLEPNTPERKVAFKLQPDPRKKKATQT